MADSHSSESLPPAESTAPTNPRPEPIYARPIPPQWIFGFVIFIVLMTITSLYYTNGNGPATVVNVLLAIIAGSGLWLLWLTPSAPGKLERGEVCLGLWILAAGIAIGSSPNLHPFFAKFWSAAKLDPTLIAAIKAPEESMWDYDGTKIVPSTKKGAIPPNQQLVVRIPGTPNGILLTSEGQDVNRLKTVEIWLQDRSTGYTSSSLLVHVRPDIAEGKVVTQAATVNPPQVDPNAAPPQTVNPPQVDPNAAPPQTDPNAIPDPNV